MDFTGNWSALFHGLLNGSIKTATYLGREYTRADIIECMGYDKAERLGVLDEYKAQIGIA